MVIEGFNNRIKKIISINRSYEEDIFILNIFIIVF